MSSPNDVIALHVLALLGPVVPHVANEVLDDLPAQPHANVDELVVAGDAEVLRGRVMVSERGEQVLGEAASTIFAEARTSPEFESAFERFNTLNARALALFGQWQSTMASAPAGQGVQRPEWLAAQGDLFTLHEGITQVLTVMSAVVPHLAMHMTRLDRAFHHTVSEEPGWLTSHEQGSYHLCWFQMHEDLLRILGHAREE